MKKYDKIPAHYKVKCCGELDDILYIEEKIDGANIRFTIMDGKIVFGTRNVVFSNEKDIPKGFRNIFDTIREQIGDNEELIKGYVIYGEGMVKHTINYNWDSIPKFIAFDVYDIEQDKYIDYADKIKLFKELGLEHAPLIKKCKVSELELHQFPKSKYYDGLVEGIVVKNYDRQIFMKCVRPEFKEEHKKVFSGYYKNHELSEYIVDKYCTNHRIDKMINKIKYDQDMDIDLPMMKYLPMGVVTDIVSEEFNSIYKYGRKKKQILDFNKFHMLVNKKCRDRLIFHINLINEDNSFDDIDPSMPY